MKEAMLYEKISGSIVRCRVCQRRCVIKNGSSGYCKTRINKEGKLYSTIYGLVSSVHNDPIEKKPVFHFKPGSRCLSLGSFGCNFRCQFCQNWEIAYADASELENETIAFKITPDEAVKMAKAEGSQGIAITYNEPAIWLEYSLDVFKKACAHELYTVWVTNGYATPETIDKIAPYLDVYRVDLKSFDDNFYQKLINIPRAAPVFETTAYVHKKYPKIHLETITNIIPGWNDNPKTLSKIAAWIKTNLGTKTPWHVTRFYPAAQLTNVSATPPETLLAAQKIGQETGLEFVYIGNHATETGENTYCPKCKTLCVGRSGYTIKILAVDKKGNCTKCGEYLNIKM